VKLGGFLVVALVVTKEETGGIDGKRRATKNIGENHAKKKKRFPNIHFLLFKDILFSIFNGKNKNIFFFKMP